MAQAPIAPAVFVTEEYVTFSDVLEGKLGPREAGAARFWVDQGSIIELPPKDSNWVSTDVPADCYDTRVWEQIQGKEDAGAAAAAENLGNAADAFAAPGAQKSKQKTTAKPRVTVAAGDPNMYIKSAFVGHSDALGTLSRRKARSSKYVDDSNEDTDDGAGGSRVAAQNYELLPPEAALAKLPDGWDVYDLVLNGPRDTKVFGGRMYVSPSGIVCRSYETAKATARGEKMQCRWPVDMKNAINWIKTQGTSSRAAIKSNVDVMLPRHLVALQRTKSALRPVGKNKKGKGRPKKRVKKRKEWKHEEDKVEDLAVGEIPEPTKSNKAIKISKKSTSSAATAASDKSAASQGEKKKVESKSNLQYTLGNGEIVLGCSKCRYSQRGCQQCRERAAAKAAGTADNPARKKPRKPTVVERLPKPA